ncbi:hypothetical protein BD414DRAFT_533870 [Trametes punicea]|nr:hypothetical protein BD414DRAFT_533870 [Trametes punicea]
MAKRKLDSTAQSPGIRPNNKRPRTEHSVTVNTAASGADTGQQSSDTSPVATVGPEDLAPELAASASQGVAQPEKKKGAREDRGEEGKNTIRRERKVRKLVPPRPFPTVAPSVSTTGPRSAHGEGKNYICVTRRTELGAYLRRCKDVLLKDGYKTLHLHAMGAAIPHLMQLALSLPPILPFPQDEVHTEVTTGTVEVQDELIPEDEDENVSYRTRGKSTVSVVIKIGDGVDEPAAGAARTSKRKNNLGRGTAKATATGGTNQGGEAPEQFVYREDEMDER